MEKIFSKLSLICGTVGVILLIPISIYSILVFTSKVKPNYFGDISSSTTILLSTLSIILGVIGAKKEKTKEAKRGIKMGITIILYYVILFVVGMFVQVPTY